MGYFTVEVKPGSRLGSYEVLELIGEGGMGSVYRATDTRLRRQVALKIVRAPLAEDPELLARFTREAQLLASLSHPSIATIHGIEESEGIRFLILELVPGITLAERIAWGPLPVPEALALAAQVAAAVEAAHDSGIIHRDLKPANVKITPAGSVKVLDFGLAKALVPGAGAPGLEQAPTLTSAGTALGAILGTPAYMSPEQARGQDVDRRTDIWAFGCVLFDMLTGRAAFARETASDTIAAVLAREPDWSLLPSNLPVPIRRLLQRALVKDPQQRLRDIGDARLEIEDAIASGLASGASPAGEESEARGGRRNPVLVAGGLFAAAVLGAVAVWMLKPSPPSAFRSEVQFALPLPAGERLDGLDFPAVAISPLETHVAYIASRGGRRRLFLHALAGIEAQPIPGTEDALGPFFSPDGGSVGFFADGKLKKVNITSGPVRTICDASIGFGAAWRSDGTIVFAPDNGSALWQVPANGGVPRAITNLDTSRGEFSHRWPELTADPDAILYTVGTKGSWDDAEIVVQSLRDGKRHTVVEGGTNPRVLPDGRLLYGRGGSVFAVPFDVGAEGAKPAAMLLLAAVLESSDGAVQLSVSSAGSIAYLTGDEGDAAQTLVWVDRQGNVQPLAATERAFSSPRLAPDGRTLAVTIAGGDRDEVWSYDIARNALSQLTFEGGTSPVWTSDGGRVVFSANRGGPANLFWTRIGDSNMEERLTRRAQPDVPGSSSPDGRTIAFVESNPSTGKDILLLDCDDRTVRPFLETPADESAPAFSPDGGMLAFVSDESGRGEVYVASIKEPERRVQVTFEGGSEPVWNRTGTDLFYRAGNRMMAVAVTMRPSPSATPARVLFEGAFGTGLASRPAYDVSPDGARFLMVAPSQRARAPQEVRVILGWTARSRAQQ